MSGLAVIIVNFRTAQLVVASLVTLAEERDRLNIHFDVFVVDNNSEDGSAELIAQAIKAHGWHWIQLLAQSENLGFAGGNNKALLAAFRSSVSYHSIFFLNPDAHILPGAMESSRALLARKPQAGIIGSLLINPDGTYRRCAFRFPSPLGELIRGANLSFLSRMFARWEIAPPPTQTIHKVDWVSGAAFMVRRDVFETIGLLDDHYFLYFEEVDFMRKATKLGWEVWHNSESLVVHLAGQGTKIKEGISQNGPLPEYWYRSWRRYFVKNHGRSGAVLAGSCWLLGEAVHRLKLFIQRRRPDPGAATINRFLKLALVPAVTRGAK